MILTESDWASIEDAPGESGFSSRLLDPASKFDLYLLVHQPGNHRSLGLRVRDKAAEQAISALHQLPQTKGLGLRFVPVGPGLRQLQVSLNEDRFREVFNSLVGDICVAVNQAEDDLQAVLALVDRFEHWRRLMASLADGGLSTESRRGLVGELYVLRQHILSSQAPAVAVSAWTGPTGAPQDFQLPGGAIEVKTSSGKQPQSIVISNERELDATGVGFLLLAHISLDERRGGTGLSLNATVDDVRSRLGDSPVRSTFEDLLARVGYLTHDQDLYEEPRYTVRDERIWHVTGDFPRITEGDLRAGVGDCRYRISTAGLDSYLASDALIQQVLGGKG